MMANRIVALALVFFAASTGAQQLSAAEDDSGAPPVDSWPTYHGDYSGRHYSTQGQIMPSNVKGLSLAWIYRATNNAQGAITGGTAPPPRPGGGDAVPAAFAGFFRTVTIKSIPLEKDGVPFTNCPRSVELAPFCGKGFRPSGTLAISAVSRQNR